MDWVLHNYDIATSDPPDVETELRRLQCLKTYHMLDQDFQPCYQRLVNMAARVCQTPAALITLVDLGREWQIAAAFNSSTVEDDNETRAAHLSRLSLPNKTFVLPRETPRQQSLGAHVILSRLQVFLVTDAAQDDRFHSSPFVLGEPSVRFYAAVPLTSPEGLKLGTISVVDNKSRPLGLSMDQVLVLQDLAATTMELLERQRLILQTGTPAAPAANIQVQRSVTFLKKHLASLHQDLQLNHIMNDTQKHVLRSACDSAQYLYSTLVPILQGQQQDSPLQGNNAKNSASSDANGKHDSADADGSASDGRRVCVSPYNSQNSIAANSNPATTSRNNGTRTNENDSVAESIGRVATVDLPLFVKNIEFAMDAFPKDVHVVLTVDPTLPERICFNDLKVFRSVLALLTSACERTRQGFVRLSIYARERTVCDKELMFECEDTGPDVQLEHYHQLFEAPEGTLEGADDSLDDACAAPMACNISLAAAAAVSNSDENDDQSGKKGKADDDCITYNSETGQIKLKPCFQPGLSEGLAVHAVARYIGSLGGDYGFRPRDPESDEEYDDMNEEDMENDNCTGSIFWFSIPLRTPDNNTTFGEQRKEKREVEAVSSKNTKSEFTARSSHFAASCLE